MKKKTATKKVRLKVAKPRSPLPKVSKKSDILLKKKGKLSKSPRPSAKVVSRSRSARPAQVVRQLTAQEIAYQAAVVQFENGVKLFNNNEFVKAHAIFARLASGPAQDLAERARVYMRICEQRRSRPAPQIRTAEDSYNYGVQMANEGNLEEAEKALDRALKLTPQADHVLYALASTQALRENLEGALEFLEKAIQLNVRNRYLAQSDPDFSKLMEDPRFTELIYPEEPMR